MRFAFAGDRDISVWVLEYLQKKGFYPEALLVSDGPNATHSDELSKLIDPQRTKVIFRGVDFKKKENHKKLVDLKLDFIIGIHFPYIIPKETLNIPKQGFLNLHPAYLPFNKGWHTPSWAILNKTPIGATLQFMSEKLDEGDIIHQKKLKISPDDTAHTLYMKLKELEFDVFKEAWSQLSSSNCSSIPQPKQSGTKHIKKDLFSSNVQEIHLNKTYTAEVIIDKLRALSTNKLNEASYFIKDGIKYRMQIAITPIDNE